MLALQPKQQATMAILRPLSYQKLLRTLFQIQKGRVTS